MIEDLMNEVSNVKEANEKLKSQMSEVFELISLLF